MKKVLFVATVYRFLKFEKSDMELLKAKGYEIHTGANMYEAEWLQDDGSLDDLEIHKHQIDFGRSPFSSKSLKAYKQLKKLFETEQFEILHCHTPVAAAISRMAARKYHKKGMRVIYTSHGFHFHKKSSVKTWILYYPIEYLLAYITDMIITINKEDYNVIQKFHVKEKKYIPGVGVDTRYIECMEVEPCKLKQQYGIPADAFVILSIGELSIRKNHEVVIRALAKCGRDDIYYVICGTGTLKERLEMLSEELGIQKRVILAGQVSHDEAIKMCHMCDIGAIPSRIEGLGLAGIESLAAGKPLIASNVHGIKDYAIDGITGITCDPLSVEQFKNAILRLHDDKDYYQICQNNAKSMSEKFDIAESRRYMEENYSVFTSQKKG